MARRREGDPSPAKIMYQILQLLHHLTFLRGQVTAGTVPRAFKSKVKELTRFIRPALPNLGVFKALEGVHQAWATSVTQVMITHYEAQLDELKGELSGWKLPAAQTASYRNKAHQWARQNFGKKISAENFNELDKILDQFGNLPLKNANSAKSNQKENALERPQSPSELSRKQRSAGSDQCVGAVPSTPRKRNRSVSPGHSPPPKLPCTPQKQKPDLPAPPTRPVPQTSRPASYAGAARSPPLAPIRPQSKKSLFNRSPNVDRYPRLEPEQKRGQQIHERWEIPKVKKDILILGTSNLSRISKVDRQDAQILSYPGLTLSLLLKLLQGFKYGASSDNPGLKPSKIVVVAGLNDRGYSPSSNEVSMKKVISELARHFPGSQILILKNRYSDRLRAHEQQTIGLLNDFITTYSRKKSGVDAIPPIDLKKFEVNHTDNIHWTEPCANYTLNHIFRHLN